jgi:hypothetical protein
MYTSIQSTCQFNYRERRKTYKDGTQSTLFEFLSCSFPDYFIETFNAWIIHGTLCISPKEEFIVLGADEEGCGFICSVRGTAVGYGVG